jgi:uncharacterized protein YjeT (DUF2065 family)
MILLPGIVVVACGLLFIVLTGVVFAKPALAERFLMSFASSARAHYLEQACRLLFGLSLVVLSPAMWQTSMFRLLGWAIVISSMALLLIPWQWHHRFAKLVLPKLVRHMRLYGLLALAFGCLLLYGIFFAGPRGSP